MRRLQDVVVFPFNNSILLWCMGTQSLTKGAMLHKISLQTMVDLLTTIVRSHNLNFSTKLILHHLMKVLEHAEISPFVLIK